MEILTLIMFLAVITIPDNSGIIQDNQTNYSGGIIVNQSFIDDAQVEYGNGIVIIQDSVIEDIDATPTPAITQAKRYSSSGQGGGYYSDEKQKTTPTITETPTPTPIPTQEIEKPIVVTPTPTQTATVTITPIETINASPGFNALLFIVAIVMISYYRRK